jgi:amidase
MPPRKPKAKLWNETVKLAQQYRDTTLSLVEPSIPSISQHTPSNVLHIPSQILTPNEITITNSLSEDILDCVSSGKWTSTEVTNAFLRRASVAQNLVLIIPKSVPS